MLQNFIKKHLKNVSLQRVAVLFVFIAFVTVITFAGILLSAGDSAANAPLRPKASGNTLLSDDKQDYSELMNDSYADVCSRDLELALVYLNKKSLAKEARFSVCTVKAGENFWGIAKKRNYTIDTIVGCNPQFKNLIAGLGEQIILPNLGGTIHQVKDGETLQEIAELYNVTEDYIKTYNNIKRKVKTGDIIFMQGKKPVLLNEDMSKLFATRRLFRSPLAGEYTSLIGTRNDPLIQGVTKMHNGVDIRAKIGTWVGAAAAGRVTEAGFANGYGYYIRIQHDNGYSTLYGHLSKIHVKQGQRVKAGQLIAKSGNTGRTTGPHLHFSIFRNGAVKNPLDYLW
jgi:LysM repeat protein